MNTGSELSLKYLEKNVCYQEQSTENEIKPNLDLSILY